MWDDPFAGSPRKRKWNNLRALGLALALLTGVGLLTHPAWIRNEKQRIGRYLRPAPAGTWIELPADAERIAGAERVIYLFSRGALLACDLEGRLLWRERTDLQAPVIRTEGSRAVAFDPGGPSLYLAEPKGCRREQVPLGVLNAAPDGRGGYALITGGSGLMTETRVLGADGSLTRYPMADRAMAYLLYLADGSLAGCLVDGAGRWRLWLRQGPQVTEVPLEAETVSGLRPWQNGLALGTEKGIVFYDSSGTPAGSYPLREGELVDWDCGDFAALVVRRFGRELLVTASSQGELGRTELTQTPKEIRLCVDYVCVLDSTGLRGYDKLCNSLGRDNSGSRANLMMNTAAGPAVAEGRHLWISDRFTP